MMTRRSNSCGVQKRKGTSLVVSMTSAATAATTTLMLVNGCHLINALTFPYSSSSLAAPVAMSTHLTTMNTRPAANVATVPLSLIPSYTTSIARRAAMTPLRSTSTNTEAQMTGAQKNNPPKEAAANLENRTYASGDVDDFFENPEGVVCARGVCAVSEEGAPESCYLNEDLNEVVCTANPNNQVVQPGFTLAYLWPRTLLLICSVLYGTNFPLGRLMNDSLPASAATSTRMVLASLALSPFLFQLKPNLRKSAAICGTFTALGYISQSIALVDTPAATVSFLGALVVIVCPALAVIVDKKKMGFADAPQTWIAAITCLIGVGVLELGGDEGLVGQVGWGDLWSVLQAVGFGTSFFITERMMAKEPSQALPITAMQCAMSAAFAGVWAGLDGTGFMDGALSFGSPHGAWLLNESDAGSSFALPGLFFDANFRNVALAAAFTGFVTTAGNRVGETVALGKLSSSEASVLLATEPLWAAVFASFLINEQLSLWDGVGGALIVAACVATAIDPVWLREKLQIDYVGADVGADVAAVAIIEATSDENDVIDTFIEVKTSATSE